MTSPSPDIVERLAAVVGAPGFVVPWLDRFYDERDAALILSVAEGPLERHASIDPPGPSAAELERAWRRGILDRSTRDETKDPSEGTTFPADAVQAFRPADFSTRFEYWAMFEGWKDVPDDVRRRLCDWELADYVQSMRDHVMTVRVSGRPPEGEVRHDYVLLEEGEAVLRRAEHIYLWPCNCRAMVGGCSKPTTVCLRFENDRGVGWEISTERAVEIMRAANKAGLVQTAEIPPGDGPLTRGAICNCCADCCFPQQVSRALNAGRTWPQGHYLATIGDACTRCGRCVRRCPFEAITMVADHAGEKDVPLVEPALCRGCGVCSTGCPEDAIVMVPLDR